MAYRDERRAKTVRCYFVINIVTAYLRSTMGTVNLLETETKSPNNARRHVQSRQHRDKIIKTVNPSMDSEKNSPRVRHIDGVRLFFVSSIKANDARPDWFFGLFAICL